MDKFLNGLTLIFVIAKLFNLINWSWWLVFTPTLLYMVFVALLFFILVVLTAYEKHLEDR